MMDNRTTDNVSQFYWWYGVVEDRDDPLRMGRCRVRILGYHVDDTEMLPTEDLPWAIPIMPINSASASLSGDPAPSLSNHLDATGFNIVRVANPSNAVASSFNTTAKPAANTTATLRSS